MRTFCVSGQYNKVWSCRVSEQSQFYTLQNGRKGMGPLTGATDGIEQRQMVTSQVHNGLQYEKGTVGVLSTSVIS